MGFESILIDVAGSMGSNIFLNIGMFIISVLLIKKLLAGIVHVGVAGLSGIIFVFASNGLRGTSYPTDLRSLAFFAAAGAIIYLLSVVAKKVITFISQRNL